MKAICGSIMLFIQVNINILFIKKALICYTDWGKYMKGEAFIIIGALQTRSPDDSEFRNNRTYLFIFRIRHPALIRRFMPIAMSNRLLDISENRGGQFSTLSSQCRVSCIRQDRDIRMLMYLYPFSRM